VYQSLSVIPVANPDHSFVFQGIVALYRATTLGRSSTMWNEAVRMLEGQFCVCVSRYSSKLTRACIDKTIATPQSLPEALRQADWAKEVVCYSHILIGLQAATLSDWARVKKCIEAVRKSQCTSGVVDIMTLYLSGVFYQGAAKLPEALQIWKDKRFELDRRNGEAKPSSHANSTKNQIESELSILAALNRLWIMQEHTQRNDSEMVELVDALRPLCEDNPDLEIRTAYNLVLASAQLNPPLSINQVKKHIQHSLSGAQQTGNTQCLSIALNIMRYRLFENVVGEQALKSAKAGLAQAKKSGNLLWMSVADGMLSQSYEMQGAMEEARATRESGARLANEALARTQV